MSGLLNLDGPVMQFITKIVYSVYLNILWFICCLPIVTIGASTTALYYVSLKIVKNEEGNLTKAFFHSFKENFRQGTAIWLILSVLARFSELMDMYFTICGLKMHSGLCLPLFLLLPPLPMGSSFCTFSLCWHVLATPQRPCSGIP